MKFKYIYIFILLFLLSFLVFPQAFEKRPKFAPRKDKHMNATDAKGKQGTWKEYTMNHELLHETNYENNIKNGPCIRYFTQTAGIKEELNYYYGIREGDYKSYYYTGNLRSEGSYKKNRREEHWIFYYLGTGEKSSEGAYKNGKKTGEWIFYNRKGEMLSKGNYINDIKDGTWNYYNSDGKVTNSVSFAKSAISEGNSPVINKNINKNFSSARNSPVVNKKIADNKTNQIQLPPKNPPIAQQDAKKVTGQTQAKPQTTPVSSSSVVPKIQIDSVQKK